MAEEGFVQHEGLDFYQIHYKNSGKPGILFLHGLGEHCKRYRFLFDALKADFEILAFDQRGFGETAVKNKMPLGCNYGMDTVLRDVAHFANQLEAKDIFLYGHSMGGLIALKAVDCISKPLKGIIASSPAVQAGPATDANIVLQKIGALLSYVIPTVSMPRPVNCQLLSHDDQANQEYTKDPLVHPYMSFITGTSLLEAGASLQQHPSEWNPKNIPLLMVFGTADIVTDHKVGKVFFDAIQTTDKTFKSFEGMKVFINHIA